MALFGRRKSVMENYKAALAELRARITKLDAKRQDAQQQLNAAISERQLLFAVSDDLSDDAIEDAQRKVDHCNSKLGGLTATVDKKSSDDPTFFAANNKWSNNQFIAIWNVFDVRNCLAEFEPKPDRLNEGGEFSAVSNEIVPTAFVSLDTSLLNEQPIEIHNEQIRPLQFSQGLFSDIRGRFSGFDRSLRIAPLEKTKSDKNCGNGGQDSGSDEKKPSVRSKITSQLHQLLVRFPFVLFIIEFLLGLFIAKYLYEDRGFLASALGLGAFLLACLGRILL
jgi:hypothetical protein